MIRSAPQNFDGPRIPSMKTIWFCLGCLCLVVATPCPAAEVGTVTLLDGKPRLLRGTTWFTLVEGVRIRDSDVIDVPDKALMQLETADGGALSLIGPGALYSVAITTGTPSSARRQNSG